MKNVFIAIGGSGTKVAEALVRLLAIGCPTRIDSDGFLTSSGDSLQIWRVDPDRSSGASEDLADALADYKKLQSCLLDKNDSRSVAQSRWAIDVETLVRHLDPLELPTDGVQDNVTKTLLGVLDSRHVRNGQAVQSSELLLRPFYRQKDLEVRVDRGFYQKPFIGSAIMSVFASSLEDDSTPGGRAAGLTAFNNSEANFFLCGSLHGGTGACGVPVMAKFLKDKKDRNPGWGWRIGGGLLAPYVTPPHPPFKARDDIADGVKLTDAEINTYVEQYGNEPAFEGMTSEEKQDLVRQILNGFYADPEDMEARAKQGLSFYRDHGADAFDELYLVGKPNPNKLKIWSNGGKTQRNPLNSAEVVAAIAALNFFSRANTGNPKSYVIGSSDVDIPSDQMMLSHLPTYKVGDAEVDVEKVFLSTTLLHHLISHQLPWENMRAAIKNFKIAKFYDDKEARLEPDRTNMLSALSIIAKSIRHLIRETSENYPTGWSGRDLEEASRLLSDAATSVREIESKMERKMFKSEARGDVVFGNSAVRFTTKDFGEWCPEGDQFTRGDYFRFVWAQIYGRIRSQHVS